jgi:hypothetical protein
MIPSRTPSELRRTTADPHPEELNRLVCHQCFRIVCVEPVDRRAEVDLAPRLPYRLAHLGDDDLRKLLPPFRVQLADAPHERGAVSDSRSSRPLAVCLVGAGDRVRSSSSVIVGYSLSVSPVAGSTTAYMLITSLLRRSD